LTVSTDVIPLEFRSGMRISTLIAAGIAALGLAAGCARPAPDEEAELGRIVERIGQVELRRSPEYATHLGVPAETFRGAYDDKLNDRSLAAVERAKTLRLDDLAALERINPDQLTPGARRTRETLMREIDATIRVERHGFGATRLGWAAPYVLSPNDGAYIDLVKILTRDSPIRSRQAAEAWLKRLSGVGKAMTDELRRFELDVEIGAGPPRSIVEQTLFQARSLAPVSPRNNVFTAHLRNELAQVGGLPPEEAQRIEDEAASIIQKTVAPAYAALIAALEEAARKARTEPGVWGVPNGEAYFADMLRLMAGVDVPPTQLGAVGKKEVERLTQEIEGAFAEFGLTEGSVGARLAQLALDPLHQFPETPEGRAELLAFLDAKRAWGRSQIARVVSSAPSERLDMRIGAGVLPVSAPGAFYRPPAIDGSRPATVNLRMRTTADWPRWMLPTLAFHESSPGHDLQQSIAAARKDAPLALTLSNFPSYKEGWGLYAEDLAEELGAYSGDPLGRIGYLQSVLLRAARLVVDIGLHHEKWSEDQAVAYVVDTLGLDPASAQTEVERCVIRPGLCSSYLAGRQQLHRLRDMAGRALGQQFDLRTFHDVVLAAGPRPWEVVQADVESWIAAAQAPPAS
jgi:uncharacterized protein (DUF885 family)